MLTEDEKRTLAHIRELVERRRAEKLWEAAGGAGPRPSGRSGLIRTEGMVEAERAWLLDLVDRLLAKMNEPLKVDPALGILGTAGGSVGGGVSTIQRFESAGTWTKPPSRSEMCLARYGTETEYIECTSPAGHPGPCFRLLVSGGNGGSKDTRAKEK